MNTVGIDFGTTTTLVACWNEADRRSDFVHLGRSGPELPTTVHVDKERQLLFGDDADDELALDPGGYQRRIKLGLGTSRKFLLNGHEFTAVDLCAKFLEHVHHRIKEEHLHGKLDRVVIGVPAKFGPAARHDLETAAKQAGFVDFELIEEPVAAGIAFLEEKKGSDLGNEILVFDWGGGTLDIALVERRGDEWILNHDHLEGDLELGGEDIDDSMMAVAEDRLLQNGHSAVTDAYDRDYSQIYRRVVETKKLLSKKGSHSFNHATGNCQFSFACSREEFESVIIKQTTQAMQCVVRWKERAGEKGQSIRNVLLVGGTSQIPVVSRYLKDLGMNPIPWTHGMHAVALGAALRAKRDQTLVEKAEAGDVEAMVKLALSYMNGDGVECDPKAAFEWFERAAEGGSLAGMNWAGECLIKGIGTTKNPYLASKYLRKSALAGNAEAMVLLGVCLTEGPDKLGKPEGVIWIRKAAELRFPEGMYRLGKLLLSSGDREMGERWLRDAAAAGHENALLEIAQLPVIKKSDSSSSSPLPKGVQMSTLGGQAKSPEQNITPSKNAIQKNQNNDEIISPFAVLGVIGIILLWAVGVGTFELPILIAVLGTGAIVYAFCRGTERSLTFANLLFERATGKGLGAAKKELEKGSEAKKHSEAEKGNNGGQESVKYYQVSRNGSHLGPYSEESIITMISSGQVQGNDLCWTMGMAEWEPLNSVIPHLENLSTSISESAHEGIKSTSNPLFFYISLKRFILMSFFTFGTFELYWIYKNWEYLKKRDNLSINPVARGLFGIFFISDLLGRIKTDPSLKAAKDVPFSPGGLSFGWVVMSVIAWLINLALNDTSDIPKFFFFILIVSLFKFLFLIPAQILINKSNESLFPRPNFSPWSTGQIVVMIVTALTVFL